MKTRNIGDVQPEFAERLLDPLKDILQTLNYSIPERHEIQVFLLDASGRKKRSDAAANNWSPDSGRIEIRFEPIAVETRTQASTPATNLRHTEPQRHSQGIFASSARLPQAEMDLLKSLDRAECRPGWNFVPLKKFRDEILLQENLVSMRTDVDRRTALDSAIQKRLVLVGKVANPKSPEFPVSTIRLNRLMPEVRVALGQHANQDLDFHPVEITGEPLSTTILRERR